MKAGVLAVACWWLATGCLEAPPAGSSGDGGPQGIDASDDLSCEPPLLNEGFEGTELPFPWAYYPVGGATMDFSDGKLILTADSAGGTALAEVFAPPPRELANTRLTATLEYTSSGAEANSSLSWWVDMGEYYAMYLRDGAVIPARLWQDDDSETSGCDGVCPALVPGQQTTVRMIVGSDEQLAFQVLNQEEGTWETLISQPIIEGGFSVRLGVAAMLGSSATLVVDSVIVEKCL